MRDHNRGAGRGKSLVLACVAVCLLLIYLPTMRWLIHRWSLGVWFHTHGFLVPPLVAWLAWTRLRDSRGLPVDASPLGFLFLVPAVGLQVVDSFLRVELLSAVSLVVALPGLSLLFLGRARTRALWLPLLLVAFAVPIPLVAARKIHLALRAVAAHGTESVLSVIGYDVVREGTQLTVQGTPIQIGDACSGFATLMALTMAGLLVLYLARARWWRTGAIVLLLFPIAAAANVLRCVVLCMLVAAFGTSVLDTMVHPVSGVLTFVLALMLLFGADWLLLLRGQAMRSAEAGA